MMQVSKHGEFLTQLTRYPKFFPVSCYLVWETDGLTLIDTGLPGSGRSIIHAAATIGLPITRILLTHAHGDHVGSLDELHQLLPDAEVVISARDARLLAGDLSLDQTEPQTKLRGQFLRITTLPTRVVSDGERIGSLKVVATPGHTPGHVAYFDTRDHSLIAGDSWQTAGGLAVAGTFRPLFPWMAMGTWNKILATNSAVRLADYKPSRLAVGHGPIMEAPIKQMRLAIAVASSHRSGIATNAF